MPLQRGADLGYAHVRMLPRRVDKPWGHEIIWAETERYAAKVLSIAPGCCLSLQYHDKKEETIFVSMGRVMVEYHDQAGVSHQAILNVGDRFHVPPKMVHRFSALDGMAEVFEVSTPELDDVVRISDQYGRA